MSEKGDRTWLPRKSLEQMAVEANNANPWACPKCGIHGRVFFRVEKTYDVQNGRIARRRRICTRCGQVSIKTDEVPVPEGFRILVVPEDDVDDERAVA